MMQDNDFGDIPGPKPAQAEPGPGQLLRAARLERGLSIEDVARQMRLSVQTGNGAGRGRLHQACKRYISPRVRAQLCEAAADGCRPVVAETGAVGSPSRRLPKRFRIRSRVSPFPSNRDRGKRNLIIGAGVVLALLLLVYEIYRGSEANVEKAPSANVESRSGGRRNLRTHDYSSRPAN